MTLSIIIVNFNTKEFLKDCLDSVFQSLKKASFFSEVIIVDNGSTDGSREYLKKLQNSKNQSFKIIFNRQNLGFSRANNQGLKKAQGEFVLFLNPDTLVLKDSLSLMVDWLKAHPQFAVLGCQVLDKKGKVLSSGGFFPTLWRLFLWASGIEHFALIGKIFGAYHLPPSFFEKERSLDWVQGCALLAKRKVLEEIGGFETKFFMYEEEVELCFRVKEKGRKVGFSPKAKIVHFGSERKETSILGEIKGLLLFYQKHYPPWQLFFLRVIIKKACLLRIAFFGIIKKDETLKKIYLKAYQII